MMPQWNPILPARESDIERTICEYLSLKRLFFWKQPSGLFDKKKIRRTERVGHFHRYGIPDIVMIYKGIFVGLEVKTIKGKQSEYQKTFENDLKGAGGFYFIVRSIEDVEEVLKVLARQLGAR